VVGIGASAAAPVAEAAFPGANGRVAHTRWDSQGPATARYDGTDQQPLNIQSGRDPVWSPDGSKLVFWRNTGLTGISIINADGSGEQNIRATGRTPAWSPDGTKIVFIDGVPARLYVMNADGTGAVQLPVDSDGGPDGDLREPAWSPDGERIAYVDYPGSTEGRALYTVDADGADRVTVYRFSDTTVGAILHPEWLPDSSRIAYVRTLPEDAFEYHLFTVQPDATGQVDLADLDDHPGPIAWSPDGIYFAVGTRVHRAADGSLWKDLPLTNSNGIDSWQPVISSGPNLSATMYRSGPDPPYATDRVTYTILVKHVTGSQAADGVLLTTRLPVGSQFETAASSQGTCSQDDPPHDAYVHCFMGTIAPGSEVTATINAAAPSAQGVPVTTTAELFSQTDGDPDRFNDTDSVTFQVEAGLGFLRPKSAPSLDISLVPAYAQCMDGNRVHGPPLAFGSCHPPAQASAHLTVGTPDANQFPARSDASAHVRSVPANPQAGAGADVRLSVSATDVRRLSDLADYTGELEAKHTLRITDRLNPSARGTMTDYVFRVTVPCSATPSATEGASCAVTTTANAVIPSSVRASIRSVWDWGQVRVFDGGPDGVASTDDNSLFLTQGLFVP